MQSSNFGLVGHPCKPLGLCGAPIWLTLHARPSGFDRGAVGSRRPKPHEARLPKVMVLHDGRAIAFLTCLDGPAIRPFVAVIDGGAVRPGLSAAPGKPKADDGQRNQ
jgi:hypothetical protein